jgi:hypothetical protein
MSITYTLMTKSARMEAVRDLLNGGTLVLLSAGGLSLAEFVLEAHSGDVLNGTLWLTGFPKFAAASSNGTLTSAALIATDGNVVAKGLTIGVAGADITVDKVQVVKGNVIKLEQVEIQHA